MFVAIGHTNFYGVEHFFVFQNIKMKRLMELIMRGDSHYIISRICLRGAHK